MKSKVITYGVFIVLSFSTLANSILNHNIHINIYPEYQVMEVIDRIDLCRTDISSQHFTLNKNIQLQKSLTKITKVKTFGNLSEYKFIRSEDCRLSIKYTITPDNNIFKLNKDGVFISGEDAWVPNFKNSLHTFTLYVNQPLGWKSISQGIKRTDTIIEDSQFEVWQETSPQNEIIFISNRFNIKSLKKDGIEASVYHITPIADELINDYLNLTHEYIKKYSQLLGPYPYKKFVLVENLEQTGFGFPSFTLLGSKVIPLPFIKYTSFPHEILHNWWGNSVYINYKYGNWSEGLTSYFSDLYIKNNSFDNPEYRRQVLKEFTTYVNSDNDFPIVEFEGRYDKASQSIGYGKVLMFFHMLNKLTGEENFLKSIQFFFKENIYKKAHFYNIKHAFSVINKKGFDDFFKQWLYRKSAPKISIENTLLKENILSFNILQSGENNYKLNIPYLIKYKDGSESLHSIKLIENSKNIEFKINKPIHSLTIDPYFDIMRRLDSKENPTALSDFFSERKLTAELLCGNDSDQQIKFLSRLEQMLSNKIKIQQSSCENKSYKNNSIIFVSKEDLLEFYQNNTNIKINSDSILYKSRTFSLNNHSMIAAHEKNNNKFLLVWLAKDIDEQVLVDKLIHYGKYSLVMFNNKQENQVKTQWPLSESSPLYREF